MVQSLHQRSLLISWGQVASFTWKQPHIIFWALSWQKGQGSCILWWHCPSLASESGGCIFHTNYTYLIWLIFSLYMDITFVHFHSSTSQNAPFQRKLTLYSSFPWISSIAKLENNWKGCPPQVAPFPDEVHDNSSVNRAADSVKTEDQTGLVATKSARQSPEAEGSSEDESWQEGILKSSCSWWMSRTLARGWSGCQMWSKLWGLCPVKYFVWWTYHQMPCWPHSTMSCRSTQGNGEMTSTFSTRGTPDCSLGWWRNPSTQEATRSKILWL